MWARASKLIDPLFPYVEVGAGFLYILGQQQGSFIHQGGNFLAGTVSSLTEWIRCCCGGDPAPVNCTGNCVCTFDNLQPDVCDQFVPLVIKFRIAADISCTPASAPPNNCGTIIPADTYNLPIVTGPVQNPCCNYQIGVPDPFFICCDCEQNLGTSGNATGEFSCVRVGNQCKVKFVINLCQYRYEIIGWDFAADSSTPNVLSRVFVPPGDCCVFPLTIEAWG